MESMFLQAKLIHLMMEEKVTDIVTGLTLLFAKLYNSRTHFDRFDRNFARNLSICLSMMEIARRECNDISS